VTSRIASPLTRRLTHALTDSLGNAVPGSGLNLSDFKVVATRASMQWGTTAISGSNATIEGRSRNRITAAGLDRVRMLFTDWGATSATPIAEYDNANDIPFHAALEWDDPSAFAPALLNGADPTAKAGDNWLVTDEILAATLGLETFDQYGVYWERVSSVLAAGTWLQGLKALRLTGEFAFRHNPAALQAHGTGLMVQSGGSGQRAYLPVAIIGQPTDPDYKALLGVGHSWMAGSVDTDPADATEGGLGFLQRACMWDGTKAYASLNIGRGGDALIYWNGQGHARRLELAKLCTHAVICYGINDTVTLGRSDAQVIADNEALADELRTVGIQKVAVMGYGPRSTGTAGAQTPSVGWAAHRDAVNAGLSASAHFDAYIDVNTPLRDPASTDKWATTYFADGIHPNAAGHAVVATALKSVMTAWGF
jgi:lysophospholipase L1-like esterase